MDREALSEFFKWCTIINFGWLLLAFVALLVGGEAVANMQSQMFGISPEAVRETGYWFLALLKVGLILFSLTPWIVLARMK